MGDFIGVSKRFSALEEVFQRGFKGLQGSQVSYRGTLTALGGGPELGPEAFQDVSDLYTGFRIVHFHFLGLSRSTKL